MSEQSGTVHPVILSGGAGTRLWPISRAALPKQLLPLTGPDSLFQGSVARLPAGRRAGLVVAAPLVVCNDSQRFHIAEQLRRADGMGDGTPGDRTPGDRTPGDRTRDAAILLEPAARDTAPAVLAAALLLAERDPDALALVMPSDHVVSDREAFATAVATAVPAACDGALVTFGITPDRPETGYGYIQPGAARPQAGTGTPGPLLRIVRFTEKPDADTAARFIAAGCLWNAGIFLFSVRRLLDEAADRQPDMLAACRAAVAGRREDLDFIRLDATAFARAPRTSFDYAFMEQAEDRAVLPVDIGWSDVGTWNALWGLGARDDDDTVSHGDVVTHGAVRCYLRSDDRLLAALGVEDLVVVATADAILVANRHRLDGLKTLVGDMKAAGRREIDHHPRVRQPWGSYQTIDEGDRFKVKRLMVKPGARLSLQMHHHRAEHWVVVNGTAKVIRGDDEILLSENESIYIPIGTRHRLENPGRLPLNLIEVQSGSYLEEDDIVRLQDDYNRQ